MFTVFSKKLATQLIESGFICRGTEVNVKNPAYMVFKFEETEALHRAIKEIQTNRNVG